MDVIHDYGSTNLFAFTDAVTLSTLTLTEVVVIDLTPCAERRLLRLRGTVGSAALSRLVLQTRLTPTGDWRDYLVDADLDTPTTLMPYCSYTGTPLHQTPAGSSWEVALDVRGLRAIRVLAQAASAGATIQVEASW